MATVPSVQFSTMSNPPGLSFQAQHKRAQSAPVYPSTPVGAPSYGDMRTPYGGEEKIFADGIFQTPATKRLDAKIHYIDVINVLDYIPFGISSVWGATRILIGSVQIIAAGISAVKGASITSMFHNTVSGSKALLAEAKQGNIAQISAIFQKNVKNLFRTLYADHSTLKFAYSGVVNIARGVVSYFGIIGNILLMTVDGLTAAKAKAESVEFSIEQDAIDDVKCALKEVVDYTRDRLNTIRMTFTPASQSTMSRIVEEELVEETGEAQEQEIETKNSFVTVRHSHSSLTGSEPETL